MPKIYGLDTSTTSVGGGISAFYRFDSTTTIVDPGEGKYRFNNSTPASVTTIAISKTDGDGFARTGIGLLRDGDAILFSATHHSISQAYELTATPIDNTAWYSLSVTNKLINGSFSDNDHVEVTAIFSGASKYTELSDVPQSFTGDAGKLVAVNGTESGLEHRVLTATDIPNLDAAKITTGVFDPSEIPDLSANKITSDTIATARLGSGTANNTTFLRGDQTWQSVSSNSTTTLQTNAPTANSNAALGALVYATSTQRLYVCVDATVNNNSWWYWNSDASTDTVQRPYPGGTLVNGVGANHASNTTIANADIIHYIGTNGLTTSFTNPVDGVRITQTNSGVYGSYASPVVLTNRALEAVAISGIYTSSGTATGTNWFQFDFGASTLVSINKIAIQQPVGAAIQLHRTLSIRYSNDGVNFVQAVSFTATSGLGEWSTFDVTGFQNSRYLRVVHTSLNSSNSNYFRASEILLYGSVSYI